MPQKLFPAPYQSFMTSWHGLWPFQFVSVCETEPHCICVPQGGEKHRASKCPILNAEHRILRLTPALACSGLLGEVVWRVRKRRIVVNIFRSSQGSVWWHSLRRCGDITVSPPAPPAEGHCHCVGPSLWVHIPFFTWLHADMVLLFPTSSSAPFRWIPPHRARWKSSSQSEISTCKQESMCRKRTTKPKNNADQPGSGVEQDPSR